MQEAARREKRRLLDAQRGKCRVRLGSHLDEWCALKDHLGFSLHSQLAKFLLDSYRTTTNPGTPVPKAITLLSVSIPSLNRLALLCHQHGRSCPSPPTILAQPCSAEAPETPVLLWGCKDHQFHWDPHDYSTEIEPGFTDPSPMQQNGTTGQENVHKKTAEEGPGINTESGVSPQRTDVDPHSTDVQEGLSEQQSRSNTSPNTGPDSVTGLPEQSNDTWRVTESISDERLLMTPGREPAPKTNGSEQLTVTGEGLWQSIGHDPSIEVGNTEAEDTGPPSVEVSEVTQESISVDQAKKKPEAPSTGRACRAQRSHNRLSPSYQQALMSEPPAAVAIPCRRSPRGSKGCRAKANGKERASRTDVPCTSGASDEKGQDADLLHESTPNTDLSRRISLVQESVTEDVTRQETPSENFDSVEEQKEPPPGELQNDSVQPLGAAGEGEPDGQTEAHEDEGPEPQSSQCRDQKTSRRKSLLDEEMAQICKKRIRKSMPQELLMCEYDDCGKIFSKRQYLNYHQKYQHMNQRTFRCSVTECGKTFNFKKHLKEHEKRHSDRRDYICEFCARAFRSSSNLIIHRRIHTGEKPLQCEFCGFTCRQKASLNWHMKKHDADYFYNFPCEICGQRFEKRDNLAAHKSRKHPAPRETGPQDTSQFILFSNICQAEANSKDDPTESQPRAPDQEAAPEGVKETLFPEYLDLTESVQDVTQQTDQTPGDPDISLVIVL